MIAGAPLVYLLGNHTTRIPDWGGQGKNPEER
jgi:hypothetical protein